MEYIHKPAYAAAIAGTCVLFVIVMIFNALAGSGQAPGLFHNTTGGVSGVYPTEITPAGWTFSIWGIIYAWQAAWLLYGVSTIFRRTSYGYLYVAPGHMHPSLYLIYCFNLLTNLAWLLLWDRRYLTGSLVMLLLTATSLYACLAVSYMRLHARGSVLKREGYSYEIWLVRCLVQNGLATYAAWVTVASVINAVVVMQYEGGVDPSVAACVGLAILLVAIAAWFFFEIFLLDAYARYTLTPYAVFIFALTGAVVRNWELNSSSSALLAFLLAVSCLAAIVKAGLTLLRHARRPHFIESFVSSHAFYGSTHEKASLFSSGQKDFS